MSPVADQADVCLAAAARALAPLEAEALEAAVGRVRVGALPPTALRAPVLAPAIALGRASWHIA
eukprot:9651752-Lingulodinium_polyedra.AAC.1